MLTWKKYQASIIADASTESVKKWLLTMELTLPDHKTVAVRGVGMENRSTFISHLENYVELCQIQEVQDFRGEKSLHYPVSRSYLG